ncbi:MAG: hypothetical protein M1421_05735 [Candidatus Eremiobacteraeota bacterium]|nr:hypothetical protein [Candidatus Eremiobacteraeota bacterium]MCL5055575.1 hypothetical protein [Bacillota bacterium]
MADLLTVGKIKDLKVRQVVVSLLDDYWKQEVDPEIDPLAKETLKELDRDKA